MSISLNNHEDRIKALETRHKCMNLLGVPRNANGLPNDLVQGKTYKLIDNMSKYDLLIFTFAQDDSMVDGRYVNRLFNSCVMFTSDFVNGVSAECSSTETYARIKYIDDKTIMCWGCSYINSKPQSGNQFLTVAALKLYYNFSYNIYHLIYAFLEFLFKEV